MSTNGTPAPEQTLNEQNDTDDLISKLTNAIASGNQDEVNKLMSAEASPPDEGTPPVEVETLALTPEPEVTPEVVPPVEAVPQNQPDEMLRLKAELHAMKSRVGRVDSVQAQLAELKKLVEQQAAVIAAQPKVPSKVEERLAALKDIDPDMAETLALLREEQTKFAAPPAQIEAPEQVVDFDVDAELSRVRRVHPDLDDILVGGKDRAEWELWKSLIPPQARALAESPHAEEYSMAVAAFKADLPQVRNMKNGVPPTVPPVTPAVPAADVAAVQADRDRKLQVTPATKNPPIKNTDQRSFNPEEEVARLFAEIQKRDNLVP